MSETLPAPPPTLETVKRVVARIKALSDPWDTLADDADLVEDIGLDSIELLNFMLEIEAQLGVRIDFDRLEFSSLKSLATLAAFLDTMPKAENVA